MKFSECTIPFLEKRFGLVENDELESLNDCLSMESELSEFQKMSLLFHQKELKFNIWNWNEQELSLHFIGPMISLSEFSTNAFNILLKEHYMESLMM
jgi:hypothetical protein